MPPAKNLDANHNQSSSVRERQVAAAAHARSKKNHNNGVAGAMTNHTGGGSSLKELALIQTENGQVVDRTGGGEGGGKGMSWHTAPIPLLDTYRLAHSLPIPPAFTSPLRQAILTNPGIGRQSPTMVRKRENRRVSKDQLALAVRKNFNGAAVNEIDVITELVYKVRHQDKAFRLRSMPSSNTRKQ